MTIRTRILLTVAPLLALIVLVGAAGLVLIHDLGRRADEIIRENYVSIRAMDDLKTALATVERDRQKPEVSEAVRRTLTEAEAANKVELDNITLDGERELAESLDRVVRQLADLVRNNRRDNDCQPLFRSAEQLAKQIRTLNEDAMYAADRSARESARRSARTLGGALLVAAIVAGLAIWRLLKTILAPIRSVTAAADSLGRSEWSPLVPVSSQDEVGKLTASFNSMAAQIRSFRQRDETRVARARQAAQSTIDAFPDPVVILGEAGTIDFANPAAHRILGLDGHQPNHIWTPPESLRSLIEDVTARGEPILRDRFDDAVIFRVADDEVSFLPQALPIGRADGEPRGVAIVLHDITRFRLLDRLKSDWVATVSHELKTPLTGIQLAVHVLLEEAVGPLTVKQTELLLEARTNADRLFHLIHQLLALAKLEDDRQVMQKRSIHPGELLQAAANEAASRAEDRGLKIEVNVSLELPAISVDSARFESVIGNLIDNAIRFSSDGGTISLTAQRRDQSVELTVRDTGVGIPAADLPHVFDRFYRVAGQEERRGTGLGLAIAKEIVEAHDGTICCESTEGVGTVLTISLPIDAEAS